MLNTLLLHLYSDIYLYKLIAITYVNSSNVLHMSYIHINTNHKHTNINTQT